MNSEAGGQQRVGEDDGREEEVLLWLKDVDIRPWEDAPQGVPLKAYRQFVKDTRSLGRPEPFDRQIRTAFGMMEMPSDEGVFIMLHCIDAEGHSCAVQLADACFPLAVRIPSDFGEKELPALKTKIGRGWGHGSDEFLTAWTEERYPAFYYNHNPASPMEPKKSKYAMFMFRSPEGARKAKFRLNHVRPSDIGRTVDTNFVGAKDAFIADEIRVSAVTNLLHALNIPPSTWFAVDADRLRRPQRRYTHCRYEKEISVHDMRPRPDVLHVPPFPILSFDIEQFSHRYKRGYAPKDVEANNAKYGGDGDGARFVPKRMFPNVNFREDAVFSISSSTWWYGTDRRERVVFLLLHPSCPPSDDLAAQIEEAMVRVETELGVDSDLDKNGDGDGEKPKVHKKKAQKQLVRPSIHVRLFTDELELFLAWRNHLVFDIDPDVVTGFNVDKFDYSRMCLRALKLEALRNMIEEVTVKHRIEVFETKVEGGRDGHGYTKAVEQLLRGESQFWNLGRYICDAAHLKRFEIESQAMGQLQYDRLVMAGRIQLDLFYYFKKNVKLRKYSLNAIAEKYLGHHKVDLDPDTMCNYWADFSAHGVDALAKVLVYNVVDSDLCVDLISFQAILSNLFEMSNVCITLVNDLLDRGQQQKVYNQLVWHARRMGYVLNETDLEPVDPDKDVKGATVIDPILKQYDVPIAVLDFGSLYPSIMRMLNLCYSTYIRPRSPDPPPPAEINRVNNHEGHVNRFVSHVDGVLPRLLTYLLTARKKAKKDMKETDDPMMKQVHDGRQLALKVSANSVYGFTRAQRLPCPAITESVTATGRRMLERLKAEVEEKFNALVVYGDTDSIFVLFRDIPRDRDAAVKRVFELGNEAAEYGTKMFDGKIVLEMEKVYSPMMIIAKKRYCGMRYMSPTEKPSLNYSGIEPARRDTFIYMSECYEEMIDFIFARNDIDGAIHCLVRYLNGIVDDKVPFEKYIRSRELKKDLKSNEHEQCFVADKVRERDPGNAYVSGDRVEYVYVMGDHPKVYLKAEDPEYVREHPDECVIDRVHYIEKCFQSPICTLLALIVSHPEKYFESAVARIKRQRNKTDITKYLSLSAAPAADSDAATAAAAAETVASASTTVRILDQNIVTAETMQNLRPKMRYYLAPNGAMVREEVSRTGSASAKIAPKRAAQNQARKRSHGHGHGEGPHAKKAKFESAAPQRNILSFLKK